jgi:hypothetical protein
MHPKPLPHTQHTARCVDGPNTIYYVTVLCTFCYFNPDQSDVSTDLSSHD